MFCSTEKKVKGEHWHAISARSALKQIWLGAWLVYMIYQHPVGSHSNPYTEPRHMVEAPPYAEHRLINHHGARISAARCTAAAALVTSDRASVKLPAMTASVTPGQVTGA